jgi:hypothetical protein
MKGGGHAAWADVTSDDDGVVVSMENFGQATVAANKKTVDIGPTLRWV